MLVWHGMKPCKLLGMQNAFQIKVCETSQPIQQSSCSHFTTEKSPSTVDVPGDAFAKPASTERLWRGASWACPRHSPNLVQTSSLHHTGPHMLSKDLGSCWVQWAQHVAGSSGLTTAIDQTEAEQHPPRKCDLRVLRWTSSGASLLKKAVFFFFVNSLYICQCTEAMPWKHVSAVGIISQGFLKVLFVCLCSLSFGTYLHFTNQNVNTINRKLKFCLCACNVLTYCEAICYDMTFIEQHCRLVWGHRHEVLRVCSDVNTCKYPVLVQILR